MTDRQKIADACMLLLAAGFTISRNGVSKSTTVATAPAAPTAPKAMPPALTTKDGRAAYTCGECGQPGHNARAHKSGAAPAAAPKAAPAAAPKAAPVATAPVASVGLDDLDFDLGDLGGSAPTPPKAAPKSTPPAAKSAKPAPAPTPEPEAAPEGEASDAELGDFLDDLDSLLPG